MLYSTQMLCFVAGLLLAISRVSFVAAHTDYSILGDVHIEDMWCFDPLFRVGSPNIFLRVNECIINKDTNACDQAYNNFCAGFGIHPHQCQQVYDMANPNDPTIEMRCETAVTTELQRMADHFGKCTETEGFALWESYILANQPPHRRLLHSEVAPEMHYHVHQNTVVNWVHAAWDYLTDATKSCWDVNDALQKAGRIAARSNLRINSLAPGEVHGQKFQDLIRTHEGDALTNHGDIEYKFNPKEFWSLFNSFSMNELKPGWSCNWIQQLDGQWRKRCFRRAETH